MDSCYYENLLTVPGVSTTGGSSVHAQCLASVFLYLAVCFDLFSSIFGSFVIMCLFSHSRKHKAKLSCRNMLQMVHTRNFVTKNTGSGNAIRYLHLSTIHLVWHPPPPPPSLKIKKKMCVSSVFNFFLKRLKYPGETKNKAMHSWGKGGRGKEGK